MVALDEVTKNAIKAHKKDHRVIVRTNATIIPTVAPDISRLCFVRPRNAMHAGINIAELRRRKDTFEILAKMPPLSNELPIK